MQEKQHLKIFETVLLHLRAVLVKTVVDSGMQGKVKYHNRWSRSITLCVEYTRMVTGCGFLGAQYYRYIPPRWKVNNNVGHLFLVAGCIEWSYLFR